MPSTFLTIDNMQFCLAPDTDVDFLKARLSARHATQTSYVDFATEKGHLVSVIVSPLSRIVFESVDRDPHNVPVPSRPDSALSETYLEDFEYGWLSA